MVNSGLKEYNDLNRAVKLCGGVSKYKSSLVACTCPYNFIGLGGMAEAFPPALL